MRDIVLAAAVCLVAIPQIRAQHGPHGPEKGLNTPPNAAGQIAPRLQNLGKHAFPVSCREEGAQEFFNQGINLSYGFNHAEAARSFREAARRSPNCAMAWWGQALVLGTNINVPMDPKDEPKAWELIQKAISMKDHATERERAYIDALSRRYSGDPNPDRKQLDRAYADAMRDLHHRYPDDLDAATLYAEALMDLHPWEYWSRDGMPLPETETIIGTLEGVTKRNPDHPGALHFYIHINEAAHPERALSAADRLLPLVPGAGHLVHMPSHIYLRTGRYADASRSNEMAIQADEGYIAQCRAQGVYPLAYYPHNVHFLWAASMMEGRSAVALDSARKVAEKVPDEALKDLPFLQGFLVVPYGALTRFGKWDEILSLPKPRFDSPYMNGMWRYARGMALLRKDRLKDAGNELEVLRKIVDSKELAEMPATFSNNTGPMVLRIAVEALAGELAARSGEFEKAVHLLDKAVRFEDALVYTEPPDWHFPVRHSLGAVLLQAGRPVEAEVVYWDDLKRNPENGWALFGLMQALRAQGKNDQAESVERRFRKAWARADLRLDSSRF